MFRNSTITDLFLFVFTQLILHYHHKSIIAKIQYPFFGKDIPYKLSWLKVPSHAREYSA